MKLPFKIIILNFLWLKLAFSRDIILFENLATAREGEMVMKILQNKFNIPKKLIAYRNIKNGCNQNSDAIMQFCLKANGELEVIKINSFVVENSFRVFLEKEQ